MKPKSNKKLTIESKSERETIKIGKRIGEALPPGAVVALIGELGSGKTRFVKGLAAGLGFADSSAVTSPTFKMLNVYDGRVKIYHVDAYRIFNRKTLEENYSDLYIDEASDSGGVVAVEWADRLKPLLKPGLEIEFEISGTRTRKLVLSGRLSGRIRAGIEKPRPKTSGPSRTQRRKKIGERSRNA